MAPSAKPAPPQQSSLNEMWKKGADKKKPHAKKEPANDDAMDVDPAPSTSQPTVAAVEPGMR